MINTSYNKAVVGGAAPFVTIILAWVADAFWQVKIPEPVQAAITGLLTAALVWFVPNAAVAGVPPHTHEGDAK